MQSKAELIKELSQYTKEEIIEAIADTDNILANRITSKLFQVKRKNIDVLVERAFKEWQKASDDYTAYLNKIKKLYPNCTVFDLPLEVRDKMLQLRKAEEQADKRLETLYKQQDKLYEKIR